MTSTNEGEPRTSTDEQAIAAAEQLEELASRVSSLVFSAGEVASMRLQRAIGRVADAGKSIDRSQEYEYGLD
jgi:hypothetical protein